MGNRKTVLCVDDESAVLQMQQLLLESAGFRVLTASSGREAIRIFESEPVDVVVMDYWMPGMNGTTAARIMKQLKPEIRILFLSAFTELPGETLGISNGWIKKGEEGPEHFVARLRSLADEPGTCSAQAS